MLTMVSYHLTCTPHLALYYIFFNSFRKQIVFCWEINSQKFLHCVFIYLILNSYLAAVPREEYANVCKLVDQKNAENGRLSKIVDENQLEMFKLKEIIDAQRDSQQSSIEDRIQQDEELANEINTLQKGVH
jgi:hypothetical protein